MRLATAWIPFWETVLTIGFGSFALLVLLVIPLGARDILRLFRKLNKEVVQDEKRQNEFGST